MEEDGERGESRGSSRHAWHSNFVFVFGVWQQRNTPQRESAGDPPTTQGVVHKNPNNDATNMFVVYAHTCSTNTCCKTVIFFMAITVFCPIRNITHTTAHLHHTTFLRAPNSFRGVSFRFRVRVRSSPPSPHPLPVSLARPAAPRRVSPSYPPCVVALSLFFTCFVLLGPYCWLRA